MAKRVDIREAGRIAGKSASTIREWIKAGKVDAKKVDGKWMIDPSSLKGSGGASRKGGASKKKSGPARGGRIAELEKENLRLAERLEQERQRRERGEAELARLEDELDELEMELELRKRWGLLAPVIKALGIE